MRHAEFRHHRLVQVYDAECRWGPDDDFFQTVVDETPAARVLDLGCGAGRLTIALAAAGHTVTGVDPADASVAAARAKPGGERVTWLAGTSALLPERAFDVAVLTSHVAQFFVDDAEWARTLADLARALVPGGRLVFDARDPADRRWERWNPVDSHRLVTLPDGGEVRAWTEVTGVRDGVVDFTHHYHFDDGDELLSSASLRFRTEAELRTSLTRAGFIVDRVHGGWHGEPVGHGDGEFVVLARVGTLAPVF
ncbi:Demethylmenaquinone methyltransferase [Micromonospora saelicesensis]|uniref:Demethylmenaquinone methyltransferase n=1 Tax=Micromonospora saelicesensis TaxID=285676 RepID=A0A328NWI0_9ACTN|nr:class I SAM-dependent methyltransferase [Micromonospora saelicesensis]RAO36081.1 Demethylmenaquinone methyltransferase [Micromonospora saelicesensis]